MVEHRIMVPNDVKGEVVSIAQGEYTVEETVCTIRDEAGKEHGYADAEVARTPGVLIGKS